MDYAACKVEYELLGIIYHIGKGGDLLSKNASQKDACGV